MSPRGVRHPRRLCPTTSPRIPAFSTDSLRGPALPRLRHAPRRHARRRAVSCLRAVPLCGVRVVTVLFSMHFIYTCPCVHMADNFGGFYFSSVAFTFYPPLLLSIKNKNAARNALLPEGDTVLEDVHKHVGRKRGALHKLLDVLSLIHISEPTRRTPISYAVFCLKKIFFF